MARELTKVFETVVRGTLGSIRRWLAEDPNHRKGEFVMVIAGAEPSTRDEHTHDALLLARLEEVPLRQAVAIAVRATGAPRNLLYRRATELARQP